jgi:hypothetical protein
MDTTPLEKYRMSLGNKIDKFVAGRSAKPVRALNLFNQHYIKPSFGTIHATDIFPGGIYSGKSKIDNMILLASTKKELPYIEEISQQELVRILKSINTEEFNSILQKLGIQYDILFPKEDSMLENIREVERKEEKIFRKAIDRFKMYKLHLPRQFQWNDNIKTELEFIFNDKVINR